MLRWVRLPQIDEDDAGVSSAALGREENHMALIGYTRVSTEDQLTARQLDELRAARCMEILEEHTLPRRRAQPARPIGADQSVGDFGNSPLATGRHHQSFTAGPQR